jgi:Mrp family chromosome partitioning ATPase
MGALLAQMREQYDMIIFDTPPLNLVTDAAILAKLVDTTLIVTRMNVTQRQALQFASSQLAHVHAAVAGIVINGMTSVDGYGYGYGYSYAYGVTSSNGKHSVEDSKLPVGR